MSKRYFSIDLGHRYLKFCIAEENNFGVLTPLSLIDRKIDSFKNGEIIDSELFQNEIIEFINEVSNQIGEKVTEVYLSFSAPYFTSVQAHGRAIVQGKNIRLEDLNRAKKLAKMTVSISQEGVVWEEPLYYLLDNSGTKIRDPIGMEARTIEVYLLAVQAVVSTINKIEQSFQKHKVKILQIMPNPLPASFAILEKKDKENGVVLVDFGSSLTSISVFKNGSLVDYHTFSFGWHDLVQEIAILQEADLEETEKILENLFNEEETVRQKTKIKLGKKSITYNNLIRFLEKHLSQLVNNKGFVDWFQKLKENYKLPVGVYLFGSVSHLPEIQKIFKDLIKMPVRLTTDRNNSLGEKEHIFLNAWGANILQHREIVSVSNIWQKLKTLWQDFFINR